jgi:replication initiation factor
MEPPYQNLDTEKAGERSASPPSGYTPATNRGVGISSDLVIAPHWLAITIHKSLSEVASAYLEDVVGWPDMSWSEVDGKWFRKLEFSGCGYAGIYEGRDGVKIFAYPSTGTHCHLVMSGTVLEQYSVDCFRQLVLRYMEADEFEEFLGGGSRPTINVTRFDLAIDNCPFTPRDVFDALDSGNFRSKSRPGAWYPDTGSGSTAYVGSKKSDKQARIYDRRGPTRFELQYRRIPAFALCHELACLEQEEWHSFVLGVLRSFIEFVERKTNVSESPPLPWWEEFVGSTSVVRLPSANIEPDSIGRLRGYVDKVAPAVKALLYYDKCTPDSFFERVRLRDNHLKLLESVGRYDQDKRNDRVLD